jgi:hypothetical protein
LVHITPGLVALLGGLIALIHVGVQVTTSAIPHHLSDFVFCEVDIPAESLFTKIDHLNRVLKLNRDAYRINYGW